jgi:hypothetical protein
LIVDDGRWELGQLGRGMINDDEQFEIIEYHPIRMKLYTSGWLNITFNHLNLSFDNSSVVPF